MSDLPHPLNIRETETLLIEDGLKLKPGVKICDGYVVGKVLSHGLQVRTSIPGVNTPNVQLIRVR